MELPSANTQECAPVAVRRSTLGCVRWTGPSQGTHPNLLPPVLIKLLIDLTRLERAVGLMTHTRAGFNVPEPVGGRCG